MQRLMTFSYSELDDLRARMQRVVLITNMPMTTVLAALACLAMLACGEDGSESSGSRCMTVKEQYSEKTHEVCCKEPGEIATRSMACDDHVAIGCEGELYCTFYTDDNQVAHACMKAATCDECARRGDTGLGGWCRSHL